MVRHIQRHAKDEREIDDEGRSDTDDGYDLMDDAAALGGEEDEDREEQADQRPGRDEFQETGFVP